MKFYLQSGLFAPMTIMFSFIPALLLIPTLAIPCSGDEVKERLIAMGVMALVYALLVFLVYKLSKSKKYYLTVYEDEIAISYPNFSPIGEEKRIAKSDVTGFAYISLYSIKGWLFSFLDMMSLAPCSVTIFYMENGEEKSHIIGHLKSKEIKRLCKENGFVLKKG